MKKRDVIVGAGLEARDLAQFVHAAGKFNSEVRINVSGRAVNAKSIMGVMSIGLAEGSSVSIETDGNDEAEAMDELCKCLSKL